MRSPVHESPGRGDVKTRHSSRGDSTRSLGKRRNQSKRKLLDDHPHPECSGRISDGTEDLIRDGRQTSLETKTCIDEQLRETQSEIKMLESDRWKLKIYLEDKIKEVDGFTSKIHELELQLSKEKGEGQRFTAKIKKFIKSHNRHMRLQDELKRSHAQLQKLGEQLDLDAVGAFGTGNEDDSKINTTSDDAGGGYSISPLNECQMKSFPHRKRPRVPESYDTSNQVNPSGGRSEIRTSRMEKLSPWSESRDNLSNRKKSEAYGDVHNRCGSAAFEDQSNRGTNQPADLASNDKYKVLVTGFSLPPTGIAAHAIDDDVEVVETDNKLQAVGAVSTDAVMEVTAKVRRPQFLPPPPPIPQTAYAQNKGDDGNVDTDEFDEEAVDVDIV